MKKLLLFLLLFSFSFSYSQNKTISIEDAVLGYSKGLYPESLNNLQWVKNNDLYVYEKDQNLLFTDAKTNKTVKSISLETFQKSYPELKGFPNFSTITSSQFIFKYKNSFEIFNYNTSKIEHQISYNKGGNNPDFNSTSSAVAYTIENNLFIATSKNSKLPVTAIENVSIVSGQAIHRSEFGIHKGTFWSPKGNILAFYQKDESNVTDYPLVDDTTYPASLKNIKYPMAGQKSEQAKIGVYNLNLQKTIYLNIDTSDEHYLTNLSWSPDEKYILVAEVNRAQNHVWYNRYNASSGEFVNTIFEETNPKWTEPEFDAVFLPKSTTNFLWFSERNGFMNLYEYTTNGKLIKQLTNFKWVVTSILGFDNEGKYVFITGTGPDARENHTYKINLKSGKFVKLTSKNGTHDTQLSSNGSFLIDSYNSLTVPNATEIVATKNASSTIIFNAKNPLTEYNLGDTEFLTLKGKDGTDLFAKMIKPANFDSSKKYPVLIYVYGGPHAQLVTNTWLGGSNLWMNAFSTLENYIVFTLDNRGSANRGFEFESAIHRNLGEVEMEDQLVGLDYLKSLNYIDINRIALNGWSYGGFMTTSLMLRNPGLFTTAVAGGPVTDWKYYEIMYGERYMDTPQENPEGYQKSKVHNYLKNLDGKMLIIHGSIDNVVVPQHSMTLLQEAVKQKVQIDFFTYPMHEHNVRGVDRVHLVTKMLQYIVENNK